MSDELEISLDPTQHVAGGGLLDDVNATVVEARYESFTYPGTANTIPSLKLKLVDDDGAEHEQNWSCGDAKNFACSPDGTRLIPVGKARQISLDSNVHMLTQSMLDAGFPKTSFKGSDCTVFVGLSAHWMRKAVPKKKESDKERSVLCVSEIIALPGQKPAAKGKAASTAASASSAPVDAELAVQTTGLIQQVLKDKGPIGAKELRSEITKLTVAGRMKTKLIIPLITPEFLGSDEAPWDYDAEKDLVKPLGAN